MSAALHQSGLYGRVARPNPLLSKRYMTAHFEFVKGYLKDSQTMINNILWCYETKIKLRRKPATIHTVKHGAGSIMR
jgi:hypothetical protein